MTPGPRITDELGAHVSTAGGASLAPARARTIGGVVLQMFTKTPSQWREPVLQAESADVFRRERERHGIVFAASHDSYLINLASPDGVLHARSMASFAAELRRCRALGLDALVTHPGNATNGDRPSGVARNGEAVGMLLEESGYAGRVLLEATAGSGHALGCTFEELAALIERVPRRVRSRVGVCIDTCHLFASGYDLRDDYAGVTARLCDTIPIERIGLFHLNDSVRGLGTRVDRHAHIGAGALGIEPFRRLLEDERFRGVPKLLETPKGADATTADRRNLRRLRSLRPIPKGAHGAGWPRSR